MKKLKQFSALIRSIPIWKKICDQLPIAEEDIEKHKKALGDVLENESHRELLTHLYGCLSILDSKSSSLLGFNSILMAVFTLFITNPETNENGIINFTIIPGLIFLSISSGILLGIIWVHWSTTDHLKNSDIHTGTLLSVRRSRTIKYRIAWFFSVWAMIHMLFFILIAFQWVKFFLCSTVILLFLTCIIIWILEKLKTKIKKESKDG